MQSIVFLPVLMFISAGATNAEPVGQASPAQLQALLQCRAIQDAGARLQCYDAAVSSFAQATEAGDVVVVDREAIRRTRRSLFGLSLPSLPLLGGDESSEPDQIESTIRSVRPFEYGKWLITLADGAVWQTLQPEERLPDPRAGQAVTIRKGSLGSYFVKWSSRGISAKRVQ